MKNFTFDATELFWQRPDFDGIDYSDGQEVEERIYTIISRVSDLSLLSEELQEHIVDWPTEYHFSRLRHCLLRPLGIQPGDRVLELGCGCGAITRYLGEIGADVVSVEGSKQRARIAAKRCADLDNVRVVLDNLVSFETDLRFDWVLLIGVLEYAPLFAASEGGSPVQKYLQSASGFLADKGRLVIAIENQLGLKYFNGCGEDHTGIPYFGINDLYSEETAVTYGRKEIIKIIKEAGLDISDFFYPFPDYKIPNIILHSSAFAQESLQLGDLLLRCGSRDYAGNKHRLFSEQFSLDVLVRNQLVEDLSNSFLIVTGKGKQNFSVTGTNLVWIFSCVARLSALCMQTVIAGNSSNGVRVYKQRIDKSVDNVVILGENPSVLHRCSSEPYQSGELFIRAILQKWLVVESREECASIFFPWFQYIKEQASLKRESDPHHLENWQISGDFIDALPFNCIRTGTGEVVFFDREWFIEEEISIGWILYRAIVWSLSIPVIGIITRNGQHPRKAITVQFIMESICRECDLVFEQSSFEKWKRCEQQFHTTITTEKHIDIQSEFNPPANVLTYVAILEARIQVLEQKIIGSRVERLFARSLCKLKKFFRSRLGRFIPI